ncbi:hypothetical protein [Massilia sp. CF038]|uniref:hypothetical protein n=1 Tax=Massilia sp. CF038 TaxID=1881045 RepID=UPI00091FA2E9|nr:hypothetical protein [Massilia sp. CF038]SHH67616.1 hypothetical protein SAMN05428948_4898 [Massilia sp. CF038]
MRKTLLLLSPLLLAGCVKQSATYYANEARDQVITVRAEQAYFWDKNITLQLVIGNLPNCQRAIPMQQVPVDDVAVEVFAKGDAVYSIRSGSEVLQVELNDCTELPEPPQEAMGDAVGIFRVGTQKEKMDFEAVAAPKAAPAPAPEAPAPEAPQ